MYLSGMSHTDLINLWPSLADFAADISVPYGTAKAMRRRGAIPDAYWLIIVQRAAVRGLSGVTLEALASAVAIRQSIGGVQP